MSSETGGEQASGTGRSGDLEALDLRGLDIRDGNEELALEDLDARVAELLAGETDDPADGSFDTAVRAHQLAKQLADLGRVDEAAALYRRSLAIKQRVLGPGDPEVATTLHNLALLFKAAGRPEEAQSLWAEARAVLGT